MREIEKPKVKLKLWMVEKRASKKFEEISSKKKKSNKSKNMLKWIRSNFECLSGKQRITPKIISLLWEEILKIVKTN